MAKLRITYNAPVVLTFTLLSVAVMLLPQATRVHYFSAHPRIVDGSSYVGMFTFILGHGGWDHLIGNFMLILLVGPILEERHGSLTLLFMMLVTALVTGLVQLTTADSVLMGASGIVFMMILLASTANIREGEIPLTFIAVAVIYLGAEVYKAVAVSDNVSRMAHLLGGISGAGFGFLGARGQRVQSTRSMNELLPAARKPPAGPKLP